VEEKQQKSKQIDPEVLKKQNLELVKTKEDLYREEQAMQSHQKKKDPSKYRM